MPGSGIDSIRRALVALGTTDLVRFRVQQAVQGLLDARAYCLVNVPSQLPRINSNRILQALGCIL
jgi:hypothetical protein